MTASICLRKTTLLTIVLCLVVTGCTGAGSSSASGIPLPAGDWPVIPQPSTPYQDTASTSSTLTVIRPLSTDYNPYVIKAFGD